MEIEELVPILSGLAMKIGKKWVEIDIKTLKTVIKNSKNLVLDSNNKITIKK